MDERTKQRLLRGDLAAGQHDPGVQLLHVAGAVVGQGVTLEIRPPVFVGVEFRGVAGQVLQVESPASPQQQSQHFASVAGQPVPHDKDCAMEMRQEVAQELDDLLLPDGSVQVEAEIPAQPMTPWRDRQPADRRDPAVVSGSVSYDRGLSTGRPRSTHQGGQQEAGLINEDQMGLPTSGPSLDPQPVLLDPRSDPRLIAFDRPAFRLLRGKNPTRPSLAARHRHGSERPNAAGSTGRSADRSTGRWRSHTPTRLSAGTVPAPVVVEHPVWGVAPARDEDPGRPPRSADTRSTIGRHFAAWSSTSGISGQDRDPVGSASQPSDDEAPVARDFHVVSCFIESAIQAYKLYFYRAQ